MHRRWSRGKDIVLSARNNNKKTFLLKSVYILCYSSPISIPRCMCVIRKGMGDPITSEPLCHSSKRPLSILVLSCTEIVQQNLLCLGACLTVIRVTRGSWARANSPYLEQARISICFRFEDYFRRKIYGRVVRQKELFA